MTPEDSEIPITKKNFKKNENFPNITSSHYNKTRWITENIAQAACRRSNRSLHKDTHPLVQMINKDATSLLQNVHEALLSNESALQWERMTEDMTCGMFHIIW